MGILKKIPLVVLFCLMLGIGLTGCHRSRNPEPTSLRVVTEITVTYDYGSVHALRSYTHEEKMRQILNYLRQIDPYGDPAENPETADGSDYRITCHYSDGSQKCYRQKGDRYFQGADGIWRNIDPKRAMHLGFILGKMRSDPHS